MPDPIVSEVYPEVRFGGFTRCDGTIAFYTRVRSLLRPENVVLDVGCGRGSRARDVCPYRKALQNLRGSCRRVIGIDVDPNASVNPFIDEFRLLDTQGRWPVDDRSVDLAFADYVLEHVEEPDAFFRELNRVLKPAGYFCIRTPNTRSYICVASRIVPNRWHTRATKMAHGPGSLRTEKDVFPTFYRCNTKRKIRRYCHRHGLEVCVYAIEPEPSYLNFSPLLYRVGAALHRLIPPPLMSTLLAYGQKP
jgi:SAM-dependent methyltransferase